MIWSSELPGWKTISTDLHNMMITKFAKASLDLNVWLYEVFFCANVKSIYKTTQFCKVRSLMFYFVYCLVQIRCCRVDFSRTTILIGNISLFTLISLIFQDLKLFSSFFLDTGSDLTLIRFRSTVPTGLMSG